ncbi:hypothetical protein ACE939_11355 [Aquimarina sp. W85]|uniref:hypothetical protein n=1 Tax=Aquimarina rhodophyticola TaxID=3342246 RepID=UPI00366C48B6
MKSLSLAYFFCYLSILLVFFVGLFFGNYELIPVKTISSIALIWIYYENREQVSSLYLFIISIIIINDILVLSDFDRYFNIIGILLPLYYILSSYVLLPYISIRNFRYKEVFTPSVFIGMFLILYLTFSIFSLVLNNLRNSIGFAILIIGSLFYYLASCFVIYIRNQYSHAYYVLIAAICCILVNAMLPVQELYYNNSILDAVIYSTDVVAMLFYLKFLIAASYIDKSDTPAFF